MAHDAPSDNGGGRGGGSGSGAGAGPWSARRLGDRHAAVRRLAKGIAVRGVNAFNRNATEPTPLLDQLGGGGWQTADVRNNLHKPKPSMRWSPDIPSANGDVASTSNEMSTMRPGYSLACAGSKAVSHRG